MKSSILYCLIFIAISSGFSSCGGGNTPSDSGEEKKVEKAKALSPLELGETIAGLYVQAIEEVVETVSGNPPTAEIQPKLSELKEKYVLKLVELGKQREAMEEAERKTVDLNIRIGIQSVYSTEAYTSYGEAVTHYFKEKEVHKLLTDFNILTQYASYDLLKEQAPEEASRLGI
jgi:hypothetical protein